MIMGFHAFKLWLQQLAQAADPPEPDEDREEPTETEPEPLPWKLRSVGAWVGWQTMRQNSSIERDLKFAKQIGLGRLDVIVNDFAGDRRPTSFGTYNKSRIIHFCERAIQEGFAVHLMTWVMPHEAFIRKMGKELTDLTLQCEARSVMLDAEEPWTQAVQPMPWVEAASLVKDVFGDLVIGVTGIGYAPVDKVGPLVRVADYMVPQCYSTSSNDLDPATACPQLADRWRRRFGTEAGRLERELVIGLAGYRQSGRPGYSKKRFMTEAFNAAIATQPTDIVYWSLRHIRGSASTAAIIQQLSHRATHQARTA